jgi:ribonuclease G
VAKEPLGTKGARLTSHATVRGPLPGVHAHRWITWACPANRIARRAQPSPGHRPAVPRAARFHGRRDHPHRRGRPSDADIINDLQYFHDIWTEVRRKYDSMRAPAVIYREQSLVSKLLRDLLTEDFSAIRIDNAQEHRHVLELIQRIMPNLAPRVKLYNKDYPIFEEYGVQAEIDKALKSKVWLKSGGLDCYQPDRSAGGHRRQHGRYVGKRTGRLEDTIVKTNLEAVKEIVRQIRLRDLGGIIVLDFIDMEERKNRQKVLQTVEQELKKDRSPSKVLQVSDFGLVIVTRKRVKQSLERVLTEPCPYCSGTGVIKSTSTICYEILAEVKKIGRDIDGHGMVLRSTRKSRAR